MNKENLIKRMGEKNMKPAELAALVKERIGAKIQECTLGG